VVLAGDKTGIIPEVHRSEEFNNKSYFGGSHSYEPIRKPDNPQEVSAGTDELFSSLREPNG
jgi:hypothetical protein